MTMTLGIRSFGMKFIDPDLGPDIIWVYALDQNLKVGSNTAYTTPFFFFYLIESLG